uniref:Uncharacterized protein n=1 Tax=Oryza meridionalis TaxID=40149 RepID=A0A0E0EKP0_9ORYZ
MGSRYWSLGSPQAGTEENNQGAHFGWAVFSASAHQQRTGSGFNPGRSQDSRRSHYTSQTVLKDSHGIGVQATRHGHAEHYGVIPGIKISVSNSRHHANRFQVLGY